MENINEKLLKTVILGLLKEIKFSVDNGKLSSELLEGDLWFDTPDQQSSINLELDWSSENVKLTATSFDIKINNKGFLEEDCTSTENQFLELNCP